MSTSPWYSFLVACASAASTAPKTTSRSTFFSREMASTSINNSRFISRLSCNGPGLAPLEIYDRCQSSFLQLAQLKTQYLHRCRLPLPADFLPRLDRRLVAPRDLPATVGTFQPSPELLAVHGHLAICRRTHRGLQRDVHHLAGKAFEILLVPQRTIGPWGRHLQPLVFRTFHFQDELQLARHLLAVLHIHELFRARGPGQV